MKKIHHIKRVFKHFLKAKSSDIVVIGRNKNFFYFLISNIIFILQALVILDIAILSIQIFNILNI